MCDCICPNAFLGDAFRRLQRVTADPYCNTWGSWLCALFKLKCKGTNKISNFKKHLNISKTLNHREAHYWWNHETINLCSKDTCPNSCPSPQNVRHLNIEYSNIKFSYNPNPYHKTGDGWQIKFWHNILSDYHWPLSSSIYITLLLCRIAIFWQKLKAVRYQPAIDLTANQMKIKIQPLDCSFVAFRLGGNNTSKTREEYS